MARTTRAGVTRIWLDELDCPTGDEPSLEDCSHGGWGVSDCDHDEDVILQCLEAVVVQGCPVGGRGCGRDCDLHFERDPSMCRGVYTEELVQMTVPDSAAPVNCMEPYLESCMMDFSGCESVLPGHHCEVRCRHPYYGPPSVAYCPADNRDAEGGLKWETPACTLLCPDPVGDMLEGYNKTEAGWACAIPTHAGDAQLVCTVNDLDCTAVVALEGCKEKVPCAPLEVDDMCLYDNWGCWEVEPGGSCEVPTQSPYTYNVTIATCVEGNVDPKMPLDWPERPTAQLVCADPSSVDPGYVASEIPGRLAECASGYDGVATSSCTITAAPECKAVLHLEGCTPQSRLTYCAPVELDWDDMCTYDVSDCAKLWPNERCEVNCKYPYVGEPSVGICPQGNDNPFLAPTWRRPRCNLHCEDPEEDPIGYIKIDGFWQCADGFIGAASTSCELFNPGCEARLQFSGCIPLTSVGCAPLRSPDPCKFNTVDCENAAPGDLCIIYCLPPYVPNPKRFDLPVIQKTFGGSGGWPGYCHKYNADPRQPPQCLIGDSFEEYTDCFEDEWCKLACLDPVPVPPGYVRTDREDLPEISGGWECDEGYTGSAVFKCINLGLENNCASAMVLSGCVKMWPCVALPQLPCVMDTNCTIEDQGETCDLFCVEPFYGNATVAKCQDLNVDPERPLEYEEPKCELVCPYPKTAPEGYFIRWDGLVCDEGYTGLPSWTCQKAEDTCDLIYTFIGCEKLENCANLNISNLTDMPCGVNVSACVDIGPGESCNITCTANYTGEPSLGTCPPNNTILDLPLTFEYPNCSYYCNDPMTAPLGYAWEENGDNSSWVCNASLPPGYLGEPNWTCHNIDCKPTVVWEGCLPIVNCGPAIYEGLDFCRLNASDDCFNLTPGGMCEVNCSSPWFYGSAVNATCPWNNTDPNKPPEVDDIVCGVEPLQTGYFIVGAQPYCIDNWIGDPRVVCEADEWQQPVTSLEGCNPLQPCEPPVLDDDDFCRIKFEDSCSGRAPGKTCTVTCAQNYQASNYTVATCPADNIVLGRSVDWADPGCELACELPDPMPTGYVYSAQNGWTCAPYWAGNATATCEMHRHYSEDVSSSFVDEIAGTLNWTNYTVQTECRAIWSFDGCLPLRPCANILDTLEKPPGCLLDVSDCTNVKSGDSCELRCSHPYEGTSTVAVCPTENREPNRPLNFQLPSCVLPCPGPWSNNQTGYFKNHSVPDSEWSCADGWVGEPVADCFVDEFCEPNLTFTGCEKLVPCLPPREDCMFNVSNSSCGSMIMENETCDLECQAPYYGRVHSYCPKHNTDPKQQLIIVGNCSMPACEEPTAEQIPPGYIRETSGNCSNTSEYAVIDECWSYPLGYGGRPTATCIVDEVCDLRIDLTGVKPAVNCGPINPRTHTIDVSACANVTPGGSCQVTCDYPHLGEPTTAHCPIDNIDPEAEPHWVMPYCWLGADCSPPCAEDLALIAPGTCDKPIAAGSSCWTTCRYGHQDQCAKQVDLLRPTWTSNFLTPDAEGVDKLQPFEAGSMRTNRTNITLELVGDFGSTRTLTSIEIKWGSRSGMAQDYDVYRWSSGGWSLLREFRDMPEENLRLDTLEEAWELEAEKIKLEMTKSYDSIVEDGDVFILDEVKISASLQEDDQPAYTIFHCPVDNKIPMRLPAVFRQCKLFCDICGIPNYTTLEGHRTPFNDMSPEQYVISGQWQRGDADYMGVMPVAEIKDYRAVFTTANGERIGDPVVTYSITSDPEVQVLDDVTAATCCDPKRMTKELREIRVPAKARGLQTWLKTNAGEVPPRFRGRTPQVGIMDVRPALPEMGEYSTEIEAPDSPEMQKKDTCNEYRCPGFYLKRVLKGPGRRRTIVCGGRRCYERECCQAKMPFMGVPNVIEHDWVSGNFSATFAPLDGGRVVMCFSESSVPCGYKKSPRICAKITCAVSGPRGDLQRSMTISETMAVPLAWGVVVEPMSEHMTVVCYATGWFATDGNSEGSASCSLLYARGPFYGDGTDIMHFSSGVRLHTGWTGEEFSVGQIRLARLEDTRMVVCYTAFRYAKPWAERQHAVFCDLLVQVNQNIQLEYEIPSILDHTLYTSFAVARLHPTNYEISAEEVVIDTTTTTTKRLSMLPTTTVTTLFTTSTTTSTTVTWVVAPDSASVVCYLRDHERMSTWEDRDDLVYDHQQLGWNNYGTPGLKEIKCCVLREETHLRGHRRRRHRQDSCLYVANTTGHISMTQAGLGKAILCYSTMSGAARCGLIAARGNDPDRLLHVADIEVAPGSKDPETGREVPVSPVPFMTGLSRLAVCYRSYFEGTEWNTTTTTTSTSTTTTTSNNTNITNGTIEDEVELEDTGEAHDPHFKPKPCVTACHKRCTCDHPGLVVRCAGIDVFGDHMEVQNEPQFGFRSDVVVSYVGLPPGQVPDDVPGFDIPALSVVPMGNNSYYMLGHAVLVCDNAMDEEGKWMTVCHMVQWEDVMTTTSTTTTTTTTTKPPRPEERRRRSRRNVFTTTTTTTPPPRAATLPPTTTRLFDYEYTTTTAPPDFTPGVYLNGNVDASFPEDADPCAFENINELRKALVTASRWSLLSQYAAASVPAAITSEGVRYTGPDVGVRRLACFGKQTSTSTTTTFVNVSNFTDFFPENLTICENMTNNSSNNSSNMVNCTYDWNWSAWELDLDPLNNTSNASLEVEKVRRLTGGESEEDFWTWDSQTMSLEERSGEAAGRQLQVMLPATMFYEFKLADNAASAALYTAGLSMDGQDTYFQGMFGLAMQDQMGITVGSVASQATGGLTMTEPPITTSTSSTTTSDLWETMTTTTTSSEGDRRRRTELMLPAGPVIPEQIWEDPEFTEGDPDGIVAEVYFLVACVVMCLVCLGGNLMFFSKASAWLEARRMDKKTVVEHFSQGGKEYSEDEGEFTGVQGISDDEFEAMGGSRVSQMPLVALEDIGDMDAGSKEQLQQLIVPPAEDYFERPLPPATESPQSPFLRSTGGSPSPPKRHFELGQASQYMLSGTRVTTHVLEDTTTWYDNSLSGYREAKAKHEYEEAQKKARDDALAAIEAQKQSLLALPPGQLEEQAEDGNRGAVAAIGDALEGDEEVLGETLEGDEDVLALVDQEEEEEGQTGDALPLVPHRSSSQPPTPSRNTQLALVQHHQENRLVPAGLASVRSNSTGMIGGRPRPKVNTRPKIWPPPGRSLAPPPGAQPTFRPYMQSDKRSKTMATISERVSQATQLRSVQNPQHAAVGRAHAINLRKARAMHLENQKNKAGHASVLANEDAEGNELATRTMDEEFDGVPEDKQELPGGYYIGDIVYYAGETEELELGRIDYGDCGRILGAPPVLGDFDSVTVGFENYQGPVEVLSLSREPLLDNATEESEPSLPPPSEPEIDPLEELKELAEEEHRELWTPFEAQASKFLREEGGVYMARGLQSGGLLVPAGLQDGSLPQGWTLQVSRKNGHVYYWHKATNTVQWERPEHGGSGSRPKPRPLQDRKRPASRELSLQDADHAGGSTSSKAEPGTPGKSMLPPVPVLVLSPTAGLDEVQGEAAAPVAAADALAAASSGALSPDSPTATTEPTSPGHPEEEGREDAAQGGGAAKKPRVGSPRESAGEGNQGAAERVDGVG
eukprot:TRINITY_DN120723_c0_g1_i1.p1 TRINITY_DN120723_c0_g1~~TRINITY_DN120723_c0_g1_i1.p1  ORF type:complete len:3781 (-),score=827.89 TRINITY_DN120723_c0_g1_i1:177-10991(-)